MGTTLDKPGLVYFHSSRSGKCRRIEGYIAQVLQHRRNHDTFKYYAVAQEEIACRRPRSRKIPVERLLYSLRKPGEGKGFEEIVNSIQVECLDSIFPEGCRENDEGWCGKGSQPFYTGEKGHADIQEKQAGV